MNPYTLKVHLTNADTHEIVRTLTYSNAQLKALMAVGRGANFEVLRLRYARPLAFESALLTRAWECGCLLLKWHVEHCTQQGLSPTFEGRTTDLGLIEIKATKFFASALIVNE